MLYRVKQLLQGILAAAIAFTVCWSAYQGASRMWHERILSPVTARTQGVISDRELLGLLLNAYYMGLNKQELSQLLRDYTGSDELSEELYAVFMREGGGERYIRELCLALSEKAGEGLSLR